jgi:hypothetical protein
MPLPWATRQPAGAEQRPSVAERQPVDLQRSEGVRLTGVRTAGSTIFLLVLLIVLWWLLRR